MWPAGPVSWPPGAPPPRGYPGPPPPRPSPLGELPNSRSQLCRHGTKCRSSVCVFFHPDGSIGLGKPRQRAQRPQQPRGPPAPAPEDFEPLFPGPLPDDDDSARVRREWRDGTNRERLTRKRAAPPSPGNVSASGGSAGKKKRKRKLKP